MLSHNLFYVVLQASLYIPVLILKARKFAMLYTLGSLFVISRYEKYNLEISIFANQFSDVYTGTFIDLAIVYLNVPIQDFKASNEIVPH